MRADLIDPTEPFDWLGCLPADFYPALETALAHLGEHPPEQRQALLLRAAQMAAPLEARACRELGRTVRILADDPGVLPASWHEQDRLAWCLLREAIYTLAGGALAGEALIQAGRLI